MGSLLLHRLVPSVALPADPFLTQRSARFRYRSAEFDRTPSSATGAVARANDVLRTHLMFQEYYSSGFGRISEWEGRRSSVMDVHHASDLPRHRIARRATAIVRSYRPARAPTDPTRYGYAHTGRTDAATRTPERGPKTGNGREEARTGDTKNPCSAASAVRTGCVERVRTRSADATTT